MKNLTTLSAAILLAVAGQAFGQVQHGIIDVIENDGGNTPSSVTTSRVGGDGAWVVVSDTSDTNSRADYVVDFLTGNDQNLGILITCPAQIFRTEPSVPFPAPYFATTACERTASGSNRYYVSLFEAPSGGEVNFNAALSYFPHRRRVGRGRRPTTPPTTGPSPPSSAIPPSSCMTRPRRPAPASSSSTRPPTPGSTP